MPRFIPSPGNGGGPPGVTDHFSPRIIVGNVPAGDPNSIQAAPFQYIPDTGNGAGIVAALGAALTGYDVYIRPGTYTLPVGTLLTVPAAVTVHGEPGAGTIIVASAGDATHAQDVFVLGADSELRDLIIVVPAGANGGLAGNAVVTMPSDNAKVRRVTVTMSGASQRNTQVAFGTGPLAAPSDGVLIEDCSTTMPSVVSTGALPYISVFFGMFGVDSTAADSAGPTVRGCTFRNGQAGVLFASISGGAVDDCNILEIFSSGDGVFWFLDATALDQVQGPRITNCRIVFSTFNDSAGSGAAGVEITNIGTDNTSRKIVGSLIANIIIFYRQTGGLVGDRQAIKIRVDTGSTGQNNQGTVTNVTVFGAGIGVIVQSATADNTTSDTGAILDWTISNVVAPNVQVYGAHTPNGCLLNITTVAQQKIKRVAITGCNFSGAPATAAGVFVGAHVLNTSIVGNQLTPNGGADWTDNGDFTQITGNVP